MSADASIPKKGCHIVNDAIILSRNASRPSWQNLLRELGIETKGKPRIDAFYQWVEVMVEVDELDDEDTVIECESLPESAR